MNGTDIRTIKVLRELAGPSPGLLVARAAVAAFVSLEGDMEEPMSAIQKTLKEGDREAADYLLGIICDLSFDGYVRAMVLESVACSRSSWLEERVAKTIKETMHDPDPDVAFSAIASASDLPLKLRKSLAKDIKVLLDDPNSPDDIRRESRAFLLLLDSARIPAMPRPSQGKIRSFLGCLPWVGKMFKRGS